MLSNYVIIIIIFNRQCILDARTGFSFRLTVAFDYFVDCDAAASSQSRSDVLQQASAEVLSTQRCNQVMEPLSSRTGVWDNQICAYDTAKTKGACFVSSFGINGDLIQPRVVIFSMYVIGGTFKASS